MDVLYQLCLLRIAGLDNYGTCKKSPAKSFDWRVADSRCAMMQMLQFQYDTLCFQ